MDKYPRLPLVRATIGAEKVSWSLTPAPQATREELNEKVFKAANYALFLGQLAPARIRLERYSQDLQLIYAVLFGPLITIAQPAFHGEAPIGGVLATWTILLLTIACSTMLGLANTTLEVAIERDW